MLRPSYLDLLEVISKDQEDSFETGSRYTIVIAAAKRARQIVDHAPILTEGGDPDKPVSTAVKELYEGKIKIGYAKENEEFDGENGDLDYENISVVSDDMFRSAEDGSEPEADDYSDGNTPEEDLPEE